MLGTVLDGVPESMVTGLTIFKGGQPVQSVAGAKPKGDLVRFIESAI